MNRRLMELEHKKTLFALVIADRVAQTGDDFRSVTVDVMAVTNAEQVLSWGIIDILQKYHQQTIAKPH